MKGVAIKWSAKELAFIEKRKTMPRRELCELIKKRFDRSDIQTSHVEALCKRRKWRTGRTGQFQSGDPRLIEYNKRRRGISRRNKGSFEKGNVPHTHRELGTVVKRKEGFAIKTREGWLTVSRLVFEAMYRKLEQDEVVLHLDGNRYNDDPKNLIAITRKELAVANRTAGDIRRKCETLNPELIAATNAAGLLHAKKLATQKEKPSFRGRITTEET